jgi:hypothetical protein
MHYLIGRTVGIEKKDEAIKHLLAAGETFRALGVTNLHEKSESLISDIKSYSNTISDENKRTQTDNAGSQLLMVRLAEATASRELLFRELVAVLRQESRAKRIILAEHNKNNNLYPFISHGFAPTESAELAESFNYAVKRKKIRIFRKKKSKDF